MCRDRYNLECAEDGCTQLVTCRHEMGMCKDHGWDRWEVDEEETLVLTGDPLRWEGDDS